MFELTLVGKEEIPGLGTGLSRGLEAREGRHLA